MTFNQPTFIEYETATKFAKFRYKYGIVVLILCWLCLLFICYYMVAQGEAIASNPLIYGAEKYDVECHCYNYEEKINFYVNETSLWNLESFENTPLLFESGSE